VSNFGPVITLLISERFSGTAMRSISICVVARLLYVLFIFSVRVCLIFILYFFCFNLHFFFRFCISFLLKCFPFRNEVLISQRCIRIWCLPQVFEIISRRDFNFRQYLPLKPKCQQTSCRSSHADSELGLARGKLKSAQWLRSAAATVSADGTYLTSTCPA
jgi:hypothetical protein